MKPKLISRITTMLLIASNSHASLERINIELEIQKDETINQINIEAEDYLEKNGIHHDTYSKIYIHEEKETTIISCFDCIVNNVELDEVPQTENGKIGGYFEK